MRAPLVVTFAAGSRAFRAPDDATGLAIVQNGPPGTTIRFADGRIVPLPTDQIVHAGDEGGAAVVGFGGMEFRGLDDDSGALVFVRVRDLRPADELSPERGLRMTLLPWMLEAVDVEGRRAWPPEAVDPEDVLAFWFGALRDDAPVDEPHRQAWFKKDDAFDDDIRARFAGVHDLAQRGALDAWARTPRGALALVVVLDQFPRNMFRGTPQSFASDDRALAVALGALERGDDRAVPSGGRGFFAMPLTHAEDVAMQDRSVALFRSALDDLPPDAPADARANAATTLRYAVAHRDIVARFGRFPHRNAILGRTSTPDEEAFLREPGSSF